MKSVMAKGGGRAWQWQDAKHFVAILPDGQLELRERFNDYFWLIFFSQNLGLPQYRIFVNFGEQPHYLGL